MIKSAQGHYYTAEDGRQIYDFFSGLWTTNVGHCHPKIVEAVQKQVAEMDYGITFQIGSPKAFELAEKLCAMAPEPFKHAFFTLSLIHI